MNEKVIRLAERPQFPERQFKGIWFCAELWSTRELSWSEKALVAEIDSLSGHGEPCSAGSDYLADRLGLSFARVQHMLGELTNLGYLIRLAFDGRQILRCVHPGISGNPMVCRQLMAQHGITERRIGLKAKPAVGLHGNQVSNKAQRGGPARGCRT